MREQGLVARQRKRYRVHVVPWGWVEGDGGLMGILVRLEHDGLGQNCDGLGSPRFEDHTIPTRAVRRRPMMPPLTPRDPAGATGLASTAPAPRSGA